MVQMPNTYDVEEILKDAGSGKKQPLIPNGKYPAVIVNSEMIETKSKNGSYYLLLTFMITGGEHQGTELNKMYNLVNSNQDAVKISSEDLCRLAQAFGMDKTPPDSSSLHNIPLTLVTETEEGTDWTDKHGEVRKGADKSIVYGYEPHRENVSVQNQTPPTQPQAGGGHTGSQPPPPNNPWAT